MRYWMFVFSVVLLASASLRADDWPQWMGSKRDGVWRETGIIDKFPEGGLKAKWRASIAAGYSGPAVADGRVYVLDYKLASGKVTNNPGARDQLTGQERVLCFDAASGKPVWSKEFETAYAISFPAGPRCTPTVHEGKVYALGAEGNLYCLDAAKGDVIWKKDFQAEYNAKTPIWGFAAHPLVVGNKLICVVGGEGSVAVAFDKDTGKEIWKALSASEQGYCPPTLVEAGGKKQAVIFHADGLTSLDPDSGKEFWSVPLKPDYAMSIAAPMRSGDYLFASGFANKSVLLKLSGDKPGIEEVWRGGAGKSVACDNSTPIIVDNVIYGNDGGTGALIAVDLKTGKRLWNSQQHLDGKRKAHGTSFLVRHDDRFFLFNEHGELIIAKLTPKAYEEISRAKAIEPTNTCFGRKVVWSAPAFADKCVFLRNDKELVCINLAKE